MSAQPEVLHQIPEESVLSTVMRRYGRRIYVCSFHFMGFIEKREYISRQWRDSEGNIRRAPWTDYKLEPVKTPKDHPHVIVVMDALQRVFKGTEEFPPFRKIWDEEPRASYDIATDLVRAMSGGSPTGPEDIFHPAIWISSIDEQEGDAFPRITMDPRKGVISYSVDWTWYGTPDFAKRFPKFAAECKAYEQREWMYAEHCCNEALSFHAGPTRNPANINERHHLAAKWVGASTAQHPWIAQVTSAFEAQINCPFCGVTTSSGAPKCSSCGEIIDMALYKQVQDRIKAAAEPQPTGKK